MLGSILPAVVSADERFGDDPDAVVLAAEAPFVVAARGGRRREFATARACARRALVRLGEPPTALPPHPHGGPHWPAGVVGSITHCRGYRGAAAVLARDLLSIGIDAEPHEAMPARVLERIRRPEEHAMLRALAGSGVHHDRVLFCVKESVFKAWHPLTRAWLGFRDASVTIHPETGSFTARILAPIPRWLRPALAGGFTGRYVVHSGLIVTATTVSHP